MSKIVNSTHVVTGKVLGVQKLEGYAVPSRIELLVQETETKKRIKIWVECDCKEGYYADANITAVGDIVEVNNITISRGLIGTTVSLTEVKLLERTE